MLEWGFIPHRTDDPDEVPNPINARSEGAVESSIFSGPFSSAAASSSLMGSTSVLGSAGANSPTASPASIGNPYRTLAWAVRFGVLLVRDQPETLTLFFVLIPEVVTKGHTCV
jgi:hypothetical protein